MKSVKLKQKGLSLVELLIAMVLGLFLTAGALQMMLASRNLHRTTDDSSRIQESGRFSLSFLARDIRMAGYSELGSVNPFINTACGASNPCTIDGGGNNSDQIAIQMDPSNNQDCLGNDIGNNIIANVYFVNTVNQVSSLYCRGFDPDTNTWSGNAQPLVDGIENMQILYGVADPGSNNEITSYVSGDQVANWTNLGAVRIALLVNNGEITGSGDLLQRDFNLLDAPTLSITDRHSRQVYTTTIAINNIIYQDQGLNQ